MSMTRSSNCYSAERAQCPVVTQDFSAVPPGRRQAGRTNAANDSVRGAKGERTGEGDGAGSRAGQVSVPVSPGRAPPPLGAPARAAQPSTAQPSAAQHSTAQLSSAQPSTAQHGSAQRTAVRPP